MICKVSSLFLCGLLMLVAGVSCSDNAGVQAAEDAKESAKGERSGMSENQVMDVATFGGGCF